VPTIVSRAKSCVKRCMRNRSAPRGAGALAVGTMKEPRVAGVLGVRVVLPDARNAEERPSRLGWRAVPPGCHPWDSELRMTFRWLR